LPLRSVLFRPGYAACSRGAAVQQRGMRHAACAERRLVLPQPARMASRFMACLQHNGRHSCSRAIPRKYETQMQAVTQIHADRRRDGQRLVGTSLRQDGGPDTICVHPRESAFICVQIPSGSHNSSRKKRRTALPDPPPYTLSCRRTTRSTPWMSSGPSSPMRRRSRNTLTVVI
jgi:hypothetical protein